MLMLDFVGLRERKIRLFYDTDMVKDTNDFNCIFSQTLVVRIVDDTQQLPRAETIVLSRILTANNVIRE